MRFTIRDLLWLTVVVAMGLGWWVSYRGIDAKRIQTASHANRLRKNLETAKWAYDLLVPMVPFEDEVTGQPNYIPLVENWFALDEPLVEP